MSIPDNDYQILKLTDVFYRSYPNPPYKEILKKQQRAYNCLLFQTHYDYFIAIPYRSNIYHNYGFKLTGTTRSQNHPSGLDYTKIVILNNSDYIDTQNGIIDQDEFKQTMVHLETIKQEALTFVEDYILHIKGIHLLHNREFSRRYRYSPLQYFHNELGLSENS